MRAARTVTRVAPFRPVAVDVTMASIGLLLCGCGQALSERGSRTTVTVAPGRTQRSRTEASPGPWVTVAEPATQPGDAEVVPGGVELPAGGDDVGGVVSGSTEGRGGAGCARESLPPPPQAVRTQETATRTAPNQGRTGPCPGRRLPCSTATAASSPHRTPL
ncbi:hypothetical protein GCM10010211_33680 [Streptomyces albospinus]|uniref:Lipoprotein n=1 Tax=Streptomyces albospinus TaxID=285515 RepID=A0ABQ2V411_9ACTN|nr:hypothetical protein GCM10010211_33680 [Streptomyces albospinus]